MIKTFQILDLIQAALQKRRSRPAPSSGVLLVAAGGLGDCVLFALVLRRFAGLAQEGEPVSVLIRRDAEKMAFLFPDNIKIISVDFARYRSGLAYRWGISRTLYNNNYRLAVSVDFLRHPFLDEAMIGACRASETVAMIARPWAKYDRRLERNRDMFTRLYDSGPVHMDKVVRWTRFADWLTGNRRPPPRVFLPKVSLPAESPVAPAEREGGPVVIQPFSAVAAKQLPAAFYLRMMRNLPADFRYIVTGTRADLDRNPEFQALLDLHNVTFDDSSFKDILPQLQAARGVISVDTAMMHLAVAAGAPTLCLASAAYVGEITPYAPEITPRNVNFYYSPMPCEGCLGDCRYDLEDGMYPCIAKLTPDEATARAASLLT